MTQNDPIKAKGKLSKHIVMVVAIIMVGGLIIAFMLKYSGSGDEPQKAVAAQKRAEMIAAQIGNDTPESEANAKADIVGRDKKVTEKLAAEAKLAKENTAKEQNKGVGKYPDMPLDTGVVTQRQIDNYQAAKDTINLNYANLKQGLFQADMLPTSFDEAPASSHGANSLDSNSPASKPNQIVTSASAEQQIKAMDDSANAQTRRAMDSQQAVRAQAMRDPNELWQERQVKRSELEQSKRLLPDLPPSTNLLQEGAVIQLVLLTAIDNTLPGHVSARVTENVYDSISGDQLIIPAGTKLEGDYNQSTLFGQGRMMFGFKRIILPSGVSLRIPAWNGTDALGRSGAKGNVNNHLWPQFGTGIFLAVLARALEPPNSSGNLILNTTGGSNGSIGDAAGQVTADMATGILSKYQNMKPQLTIEAGAKISLIILEDMEIPDLSTINRRVN